MLSGGSSKIARQRTKTSYSEAESMTTRGGTRRDLFRAIEERDRLIGERDREIERMAGVIGEAITANDLLRLLVERLIRALLEAKELGNDVAAIAALGGDIKGVKHPNRTRTVGT